MKNKKVQFYIWITISVLIATVIFVFSGHNGNTSGYISENFTLNLFPSIISDDVIYIIEKIIRKVAHYGVYFVLGISILMSYRNYIAGFKNRVCRLSEQIFLPVLICFVYSVSDEFHQTFIPGRNGSFLDCLLDTTGALSGILFALFIIYIFSKFLKNISLSDK